MTPARHPVDLVVVVNGFPRLSETFVLQELLDLERRGLRLHLVALRRTDEVVEQEAQRELRASVEYLEDTAAAPRLAVRLAHAALLLQRRAGYLNVLADALASPDTSRATIGRAALLAHRLLRLGSPPLYIHFAHKPATIGRVAALMAGVPYALSAHAKDIWLTPRSELAAKVRDAEVVLTCTEEGRGYLAGLAEGMTPVRLVHHGVASHVPRNARSGGGSTRVLAVGRLVEKKGYATLLRAAALVRDRGLDFSLRIVGEGPEWPRLQRLVHELDLADCVVFLGPLTESEVALEYESADAFALACRQLANGDRDGIPNVLLEAMARGLPAVSTRLAGVAEAIVDGESGLLADQDDVPGLAERLAQVIKDEGLRTRLGDNARTEIRRRFERETNLPVVFETLATAGLVPAGHETGNVQRDLRAVA